VHWIHADPLGGVAALTDAAGRVVRRLRYGVFGELRANDLEAGAPTSTLDVSLKYTGQRHDSATGLYYFGARYYDASLGRFIQPDPVVPDPTDPQALNRYAYVRNDPLGLVDPSGNLPRFFSLIGAFFSRGFDQVSASVGDFGSGLWRGFEDAALNRPFRSARGAAGRVGAEIGAALASPIRLAGIPFARPTYRDAATGGVVPYGTALALAAHYGLFVNGMMNGLDEAVSNARRELGGTGLLIHNESHGFVNDLIESTVQKLLPGVSGLDRSVSQLVADTSAAYGRIPLAVGHSQGSLVLSNALLWSRNQGITGVQRVRLEGSPRSFVVAKAMIGSTLAFNRGTARFGPTRMYDPVAAIGNPLYMPTALVATLLTRRLNHDGWRYQEE
jgi:RHS repeat-associated protein